MGHLLTSYLIYIGKRILGPVNLNYQNKIMTPQKFLHLSQFPDSKPLEIKGKIVLLRRDPVKQQNFIQFIFPPSLPPNGCTDFYQDDCIEKRK